MRRAFFWTLLSANLAFICGAWWAFNGDAFAASSGALVALGRITALLGTFGILLQIILIGRVRPLERTFGFDRLAQFHHWVGTGTFALLVAHPVLVLLGRGAEFSVTGVMARWWLWIQALDGIAAATVALFLLTVIVIYALLMVWRRWRYELWYVSHLFVYAVVLLAFGHQFELGGDFFGRQWFETYWIVLYAVAGTSLLWFRVLTPLLQYMRYQFSVDRIVSESAGTYSVYLRGNQLARFAFTAGQYASLRFLDRSRWWQAHPYSISSVPGGDMLRFTIKSVGDFSQALSRVRPGTRVSLEGPFGIFTLSRRRHTKVLLIAGGSGIAPIAALAHTCVRDGIDAVLVYAHKPGEGALAEEMHALARTSGLVVRELVSGAQRHTVEQMLAGLSDVSHRDIYVCGPAGMIMSVRAFARTQGWSPVHYEKFSLA